MGSFSWIIVLVLFFVLLCRILVLVYQARKGSHKHVRELFSIQCVSLLFGLGSDIIVAMSSGYSFWDLIAALLGYEIQSPVWLTTLSYVIMCIIFLACFYAVIKAFDHWNGPTSRRQVRLDSECLDDSNLWRDSLAVLSSVVKKSGALKEYRQIIEPADGGSSEITGNPPWHLEFAEIYSLMSNQAHIDKVRDWHALNHCFISSFAQGQKIAVYCSVLEPSEEEVRGFLLYIHQQAHAYFHIIIAVKTGQKADFTAEKFGYQVKYMFKCNALEKLVDFSEYFSAIDEWYRQPLMQNSEVHLEDIYVEPNCHIETDETPFPLHGYVSRWLQETGNRQLALLGDFGLGKSMFSLYLTHQMIQRQADRIPILIQLRNKSPRNSSELEIFSYFASQYGINPEALRILNDNGKLLLIFDGFDEMDLVGSDDIRKRHFQSLWKLVRPRSKVLITGRPNYFLSRTEMISALGLQVDSDGQPHCEGLHLQPFNTEQILQALRSSKESVRNGIQYIIDNQISASFLDLIGRPSHLFLASQIWEDRNLGQKYKNLTSAIIINEFLLNYFERQSAKQNQDSAPYFYLSPIEREYFMIGISVRMYKAGATSITQESLHDTVVELLDIFPEALSAKNPVYLNLRNGKSVRQFAQEDDNSLLAIINDVRSCGILVNDTVNSGFCFAHKSFYDLLVAKFFLGKSLKLHNETMMISIALSKNAVFNPRLKKDLVVRKLLAELISTQVIIHMKYGSEDAKCKKIFERCQKAISYHGLLSSPQKLLRSILQESENNGSITLRTQRWQHHNESTRMMIVIPAMILTYAIFIFQCFRLTDLYQQQAADFYANLPIVDGPAGISINILEIIASYRYPLTLFGFFIFVLYCISVLRTRSVQEKAELVLLTWYYACIENQIPEKVILQQFSLEYDHAFRLYLQGKSLTEIQERIQTKKRRPTIRIGQRREGVF